MNGDRLHIGDRVRVLFTNNNPILEGKTGRIIGISAKFPSLTFFIVYMDESVGLSNEHHRGIQIIEHCLQKIGENHE